MRANPMGDAPISPPMINDDPLPLPLPLAATTAKGDQILGLMSAGWTNERHSTYISSMEACFVDQLYGLRKHGHGANNKGHPGNHELKLNIGFEGHDEPVTTTPIRRLKVHSAALNRRGHVKEASVEDYCSGTDSVRTKVHTHGRDANTSCAQENFIEASGQNFSEEDVEADVEPCKRRRSTSTTAEPNDHPT